MADRKVVHVYVDESSQTGHGFMVVGAVFCSDDAAPEITAVMEGCLAQHRQRPDKEFHWNELTSNTLQLYMDLLDAIIGFATTRRHMRYRALVVEMAKIDWPPNRHRSREALLAKFIFALVFGFAPGSEPDTTYHVWIDKRADSLDDLEMDQRTLHALNTEARSTFGWAEDPFASVRFVDSKQSRPIQAVDMITGAVAYETNRKHEAPDASRHRVALLQHVIACSTLPTLAKPSPPSSDGFQIMDYQTTRSATAAD